MQVDIVILACAMYESHHRVFRAGGIVEVPPSFYELDIESQYAWYQKAETTAFLLHTKHLKQLTDDASERREQRVRPAE